MAEEKHLEAVAGKSGLEYYVFAEGSDADCGLYRWRGHELETLSPTPDELIAWRSLCHQLPARAAPRRLQTPVGGGWSLLRHQRGEGLALAVCPQSNGHLPSELLCELELVARLALQVLQLRVERAEAGRRNREQERLVRHERLRAQADLIRSFTHDFNNLLGTILLRAEIGASASEPEGAQAALASISRVAADGARVVRHLVDFSGSHPDPDQDLLDVGETVTTLAAEIWEGMAHHRQLKAPVHDLRLDCAADLHVLASPRDLREILTNLVANACEAMPEGGVVRVEVKRERKQALLRVSDAGPGLPEEQVEQALEPFSTTKGREHLGLGLSVVHGIVTRCGGRLTLGACDLGGLSVALTMPLADLRTVRRELRGKETNEGTVLRHLKVLVVDDEPGMRETLALSLENLGHRVVQAVDGRQTLGLLRYHEGFDALVLDLVMPEMDGWEVAYFARKLQPDAAVILLTGWGESITDQNDGRVDAVLAKPVTMRELNQTIARAVTSRQPNRRPGVAARA
jgi:signal transduction histidine kinase/ActR/RegA family two-component response regulator